MKNMESIFYLAKLCLLAACLLSFSYAEPELKLLTAVLRHGDRTPTVKGLFPTDPYYNYSFHPFGLGNLTNAGKSRAYKLGEFLRGRYENFLGDDYFPQLLSARSTDFERTKTSLQLVLAALFPPTKAQQWHEKLNPRRFPISYASTVSDDLMGTISTDKLVAEKLRVEQEADIQERLERLREFMRELSYFTGRNISRTSHMKRIYETLLSESYLNLTLPEWTKGIFPQGRLLEGVLLDYDIITYDTKINSVLIDKLIEKITTDMLAARNNSAKQTTKLYLYSGHETNVVSVLKALNVFQTHVPAYSCAVVIELLEERDTGEHFIKVLYYYGIPSMAAELKLLGCPILCPFEKYLANVKDLLDLTE